MTRPPEACPACYGSGRANRVLRTGVRLILLVRGEEPKPCRACGGSGKLVDCMLSPAERRHGVGCQCEECQNF